MNNSNRKDDYITLREIWELFIGHIYWFAISAIFCFLIAITYLLFTPPTYTHKASVLVGNRNKPNSNPDASEVFSEFGLPLSNNNSNVISELHIFKSPVLMEEVVSKLRLNYDYCVKYKLLRNVSLYSGSPIELSLDSILDNIDISFTIDLVDRNQVLLSNLVINKVEKDLEQKVTLSEEVSIPQGKIKINPSACYNDYVGQTVYFSRQPIKQVAKRYLSVLKAQLNEDKAPIIELSFEDINHQRANDVLSTLIEVYNKNWISDKNQITVSTSAFIDDRLNVIESELGNVDNNISSYKSSRMLPNVEAITNVYLSQASSNKSQLVSLQNQLSVARYIHSLLLDNKSKGQLLPANIGVDNANINTQIERYNVQLLEKNKLVSASSEKNPLVIDMSNSLEMMKATIIRSVNEYISTLSIQFGNITKEEQRTNAKLQTSPGEAKYLLSEERKQKVKEELYLFLLQQREQNELSQTFTAYNTMIVNYPDMSNLPATPRKSVILLITLIVSIIVPALIIWMRERLDTLIRGREDLKSVSVPFIGEIPQIKEKKKNSRVQKKELPTLCPMLVVENKNRNIINEAFRNIRTNVDYMKPKQENGIVIMNSSLFPASGKTFFITNLSLAMAIKGSKVILIDADMRKATLSRLAPSAQKGLSNYLIGDVEHIDDCVVNGAIHPNIDIIPVGIIPPNPTELLLTDRFSELIGQLRLRYEYIFLDCPPMEIVTDSSIISKVCDMTLFVLRANVFDKRLLPEIDLIYKSKSYNGLALVLNGVDYSKGSKYGYGKYGYDRYGYGRYGTGYYTEKD